MIFWKTDFKRTYDANSEMAGTHLWRRKMARISITRIRRIVGRSRPERSEIERREVITELTSLIDLTDPMRAAIVAAADEVADASPYDAVGVLEACEALAMYGADAAEIVDSIEAVVHLATFADESPEIVAEYAGEAKNTWGESYTYICNAARREIMRAQ